MTTQDDMHLSRKMFPLYVLRTFVTWRCHACTNKSMGHLNRFCSTSRNSKFGPKYPLSSGIYVPYKQFLERGRRQALRSVMFKISDAEHCHYLYRKIRGVAGGINNALHFRDGIHQYLILELSDAEAVEEVLAASFYVNTGLDVKTRVLYYKPFHQQGKVKTAPIIIHNDTQFDWDSLNSTKSLSDQMEEVYDGLKLEEFNDRLHFLVCSIVEDLFGSVFPHRVVAPFGSAANGLGLKGCDLDMNLTTVKINKTSAFGEIHFLTRPLEGQSRMVQRTTVQIAAKLLSLTPLFHSIQSIAHARVPIAKFFFLPTVLECDLSAFNDGHAMSEMLYTLVHFEKRFPVLLTSVKKWAEHRQVVGIVAPHSKLSNIQLTVLVIFFLQTLSKPILPPLRSIARGKVKEDGTIDSVQTDIYQRYPRTRNTQNTGDLLLEFFRYYSNFQFHTDGICIVTGRIIPFSDIAVDTGHVMYLKNPFEADHNVAANVRKDDLELFRTELQRGLQVLESDLKPGDSMWGLTELCKRDCEEEADDKVHTLYNSDDEPMFEDIVDDQRSHNKEYL